MKILRATYLLFLALFVLSIVSCGDDDDASDMNVVTIQILEPTTDEVFSDCSAVHVHVEVSATDENHEFEVILHPEGDTSDKIIDFDMHDHDQLLVFEQDVNLCNYAAGTCFHLEVKACVDHDCEMDVEQDVEFCLQ